MSYPVNDITTDNLDSASDSIGLARVELYNALVRLSELIDSRGDINGLAPLDVNSQIPAGNMPTTFTSGGTNNIIFQPASGVVLLQYALGLQAKSTAELKAINHPAGTLAYCSDGNTGSACLAVSNGVYDGAADIYEWNAIALDSLISST
jgi:hypothetical protein